MSFRKLAPRSIPKLVVLILIIGTPFAMAHSRQSGEDGRIPGQPDFRRIGKAEIQFHPNVGAYTYKRGPNAPPMWFHVDDILGARASETSLPTTQEPIVCTQTGHRIRVMYSSAGSFTPSAERAQEIRTSIRRMASKILSESLRSSGNARGLRMAVECDESGEIRIQGFKSSGDVEEVFGTVDSFFGAPSGANSVKTVVFYDGEDPDGAAAGYGLSYDDDDKSSSDSYPVPLGQNNNRVLSASAVVYRCCWARHTPIHEVFHTLGAVQDSAPASTTNGHCWDGLDVLCYDDGGLFGGLYQEKACPATEDFQKPEKFPIDCEYNTYFDSVEESGEWLNSHWNSGGAEDPFLVAAPAVAAPTVEAVSVSGVNKTGATFGGTIKPNGLPTQYQWEYGLTAPAYGTKVPVPAAVAGSNLFTSQTVSSTTAGLLPNTTYHYRLTLSNAKGTVSSSDQTFTTPVSWNVQFTPNASGAEHSRLEDMSCEPASTSACTAVGKQTSSLGTSAPYAQYWNGSSWSNQSTSTPVGATASELQADHCLSKTSCVAAGSYTTGAGTFSLVEVWNGTSWSIQTTPNPAGATETRLTGVSCKEISACMAVGYKGSGSSSQPVAILGNSGSWSLQSVPLPTGSVGAELTGVECTSTTSCRAVGRYYPTSSSTTYWGMVATWNGSTWSSEAVPKPTGSPKRSTLLDISCAGAGDCTAVGGYMNSSSIQVSYVERWNGTSWSWQASPNPAESVNSPLQNVSCVASSPCVAVGDWLDPGGTWRPMAQFWNGTAWVLETVEAPAGQTFGVLDGVACRSRCLAVGYYTTSGKDKTLGEIR
jgi:hypothetical protein